ncbi:hypothetical protein [Ferrimonas balearica]|uniref:hypothetical protein n=1 Tax=Ferrimonas balearica TaxID=44012 RepID=UPI001C999FB8|nr:hypothetical protein [Ferrimonas balearica]MBY5990885.1 hypothetical protein [Ferrimonas balearica]
MKKVFVMSVVCASVLAVTGCSDDTEYVQDPAQQELIDQLTAQNAQLESDKSALESDNAALQTKAESYISRFPEQCAEIGVAFDYVDPNAPAEAASVALVRAMSSQILDPTPGSCASCHGYEGEDNSGKVGAPAPHGAFGNAETSCDTCHATDEPDSHYGDAYLLAHTDYDPGGPSEPMDPTDPTFDQPTFGGSVVDGKTGASGPSYYGSGSYLNADYLAERINGKVYNAEWALADKEEGEEGVTTLTAACQLEGRESVLAMFPDDGQEYVLNQFGNQIGTKTVVTVSKYTDELTGEEHQVPNVAVFGYGLRKEGDSYFASMSINHNNTCYNAVMNGDVRLNYYEYEPMNSLKVGPNDDARNRGARILGTVDLEKTLLANAYWDFGNPVYGGSAGAIDPKAVDWTTVGSCSLVIKVDGIIPLG